MLLSSPKSFLYWAISSGALRLAPAAASLPNMASIGSPGTRRGTTNTTLTATKMVTSQSRARAPK
jgi:hypothetical protein